MEILGIGECMIELYTEGSLAASRNLRRQVGGDVYNTLVAMSRLGSQTSFLSRIAMDGFGQVLLQQFTENNIDTQYVQKDSSGVNGLYVASINDEGRHEFVYYRQNSAASRLNSSQLTPRMIESAGIVYASGITQAISPSARETVLRAFHGAKQHGVLVAYDPNYRPALWKDRTDALEAMVEVLPYVDVILPTADDLKALFNFEDVPHMLDYFRWRDVPIVALKQGPHGATLGYKGYREDVPAYPVSLIRDTIGAGDAFNGGFLYGLLQKRSLLECAQIGTIVAACSLQEAGPIQGLPAWPEVDSAMRNLPVSMV